LLNPFTLKSKKLFETDKHAMGLPFLLFNFFVNNLWRLSFCYRY